mgnify:CR=1 FL=1
MMTIQIIGGRKEKIRAGDVLALDRPNAGGTAKPETVARIIVKGLAKGKRKVFAPKLWAPAALIIRTLPAFVFDRIKV